MNITFQKISITELENNQNKFISKTQSITLKANPFKDTDNIPTQILAKIDGEIAGSILCFPSKILVNNQEFTSNSGSSLYVNPLYRGHGIGTKLSIQRLNASKNKISLAAGLSHMSLPIFKKLGCTIFYPDRYILFINSKILYSKWLKGIALSIISKLTNVILKIPLLWITLYTHLKVNRFCITQIKHATEDIEKIFNADTHTFKELHNIEWFNWHLDYNFSDDPRNHQDLYLVSKNNENIGFFMTKVRFKEKAGQGKLKNLLIGSIIEWGSINPQILTDKELCIMAINKLYKKDKVDIIDIMTDDADTISFLRKSGLKKNGTGNFAIYTGEDSPLNKFPEYKVQTNWRIRPATSDNGLS